MENIVKECPLSIIVFGIPILIKKTLLFLGRSSRRLGNITSIMLAGYERQ